MARRREVEIFGISMLDTVTCGLGAAIVLMLVIAMRIPPQAQVIFEHVDTPLAPQADQSEEEDEDEEEDKTRRLATSMLTVFFEFEHPVPLERIEVNLCGRAEGLPLPDALRRTPMGHPGDLFNGEDERKLWGQSLWWIGTPAEMVAAIPCIRFAPNAAQRPTCQRMRYLAGAQQGRFQRCRREHEFKPAPAQDGYIFEPWPRP